MFLMLNIYRSSILSIKISIWMNIFAIIMLIGFMTISLIPTFKSRIIYIKSRDIFVFVIYIPNFIFRNKVPVYIEFCLPMIESPTPTTSLFLALWMEVYKEVPLSSSCRLSLPGNTNNFSGKIQWKLHPGVE